MKRRTVLKGAPSKDSLLSRALSRRRSPRVEKPEQVEPIFEMGPVEAPVMEMLSKARIVGRMARQTEYLHVSDLLGKCMRKFALFESLKISPKPQSVSLTDALTYAQGDAIHDVLRARLVQGAPDKVWGKWRCSCGHHTIQEPCTYVSIDKSILCGRCSTPAHVYVEATMRDEEFKIVGNPDIVLYLAQHDALYVTELKSISHDQWRELVRPHPDHVLQVVFYWFLMHRKGYRLADKVSVVYATKGWMFSGSPCKEFVLNPLREVERLKRYTDYAVQLQEFRKGGALPIRVCSNPRDTLAKNCEVCTTCFEGNSHARPVEISVAQALAGGSGRRRA